MADLRPRPDWECPECDKWFYSGDYPDHWCTDARQESPFDFKCDCGCHFQVHYEYLPSFYEGDIVKSGKKPDGP